MITFAPFSNQVFGIQGDASQINLEELIGYWECNPHAVLTPFYECHGLLVLRGMEEFKSNPQLLVRLSSLFGSEVENYHRTMTNPQFFHESVEEILVLSNMPPCSYEPPPQPNPPLTAKGTLPVSYPHRKGWHTDQSYRRPPPDVSLLLGLICPPPDQGQTIYTDCINAYQTLSPDLKDRIANLKGIHAMRLLGRTRGEVASGDPILELKQNQISQKHPLVRTHPETGKKTLYLCDPDQMDFIDGPIDGLEQGIGREGDQLLDKLVRHCTQREFIYVHEWQVGDLVIHDNRNMLHTATWYDSEQHSRLMWRTSVLGNPGEEYKGENKSWLPPNGGHVMEGLEGVRF